MSEAGVVVGGSSRMVVWAASGCSNRVMMCGGVRVVGPTVCGGTRVWCG